MFSRLLQDLLARDKKSCLLLGPRQVGKSTLMRALAPDLVINLANEAEFLAHASDPRLLAQRLKGERPRQVLIDEVQRLPRLLNTVQAILDEGPRPPRFLLTGSSARKLRRGRANLLPGRIHSYRLGPLTVAELGDAFDEERAFSTGTLPGIYAEVDGRSRKKTLLSYASTYVREEIQAEALTRSVEGFARFLRVAAAGSGQFIDQTRLAKEAMVARATLQRYYEILEDTLLAYRLDAFARSERRRLVQHPRYFLFDVGLYNALAGSFDLSVDRVGIVFEHFLLSQIMAVAAAADAEIRVSSYRTEHGAEVDFVVEAGRTLWAIEAKASRQVGPNDTRGLQSFADFVGRSHRSVIVYLGEHRRVLGDVEVLPYQSLLAELQALLS
ncbi:MAG: ATP-binding protein [Deltaproteobacteria bacterium]|nr:ATP-binding protein [Deltaproteobacteria bacterium]